LTLKIRTRHSHFFLCLLTSLTFLCTPTAFAQSLLSHFERLSQEQNQEQNFFFGQVLDSFPTITTEAPAASEDSSNSSETVYAPLTAFRETFSSSATPDFLALLSLIEEDLDIAQTEFQYAQYALASEERMVIRLSLVHELKKYTLSEILAKKILKKFPQSRYKPLVYYIYNLSRFAQGKLLDKDPLSHELLFTYAPSVVQSSFLRMLSAEASQKGLLLSAIGYLLDEIENPRTQKLVDPLQILSLLDQVQRSETLELIRESYADLPWVKQNFPSFLLKLLLKEQQYTHAFQLLHRELAIANVTHNQKRILELEAMQREVNNVLKVRPHRIGVILPMGSNNHKIVRLTRQTLEGLRLALQAPAIQNHPTESSAKPSVPESIFLPQNLEQYLEQNSQADTLAAPSKESLFPLTEESLHPSWELVFRDSGLDAQTTERAVQELVEKENVIAIIGPLTRKTSEAAAHAAQQYKVPLISLSLTSSIPDLGDYVFRNNKSWKDEIRELIRIAVDYNDAHRFAILYANNREGRKKMRFFWDEVEAQGHVVHAVESFKPKQIHFVKEFDGITGKNRFVAPEEKQWMKEWKEKQTPVNDFDALFIVAGNGNTYDLKILFPYIEVYKLGDKLLLGDSTWNQKTLLFAPGQGNLRNTIFVDNFFPQSSDPKVKAFMSLHKQKAYQHRNYQEPSAYTAYAYDTVRLLMNLLQDESKHSRQDLRDALLNMPLYNGVTSSFRFQENGEIDRKMQKLTFRRNRIAPVLP